MYNPFFLHETSITYIYKYESNRYSLPLSTYKKHKEVGITIDDNVLIIHNEFYDYIIAEHKINPSNRTSNETFLSSARKSIKAFDFGFQRSITKEQMLRLSDCLWIEDAYNIMFWGPPSVGKTYLATALAYEVLDKGYSVSFVTLVEFR